MKLFTIPVLLLVSVSLMKAQAPVDVNGYPSTNNSPLKFLDYDGSGNTIFVCFARPLAPNPTNPGYNFSLSVGASTLTSIAVSSNVGTVTTVAAHGLFVGNKVVVSGSTTTTLNATYYVLTVPSSTTFTVTTAGTSNGTYNDSGMTLSGSTPLLTGAIWSIEKLTYNGSSQLTSVQWAGGTPGVNTFICANRAITSGAGTIYYQ